MKEVVIANFIKKNHKLVHDYYFCYYRRYKEDHWQEQLRILFVNALNAGGTGMLGSKAESIQLFEEKVKEMKKPTYAELSRVFDAKSYYDLFKAFKDFKQIGPKKAALFLRDIFYFSNIIENVPPSLKNELLIPVDIVKTRTVNSIFHENYKSGNKKAFNEINDLAKKIFPDKPILLEDLWFWGRFYRCIEDVQKKGVPYCGFNKSLLAVDINSTPDFRKNLLKFSETNKGCPFYKICMNKKKSINNST